MTEPHADERQTDDADETAVSPPGGESPDPEFNDEPIIGDREG